MRTIPLLTIALFVSFPVLNAGCNKGSHSGPDAAASASARASTSSTAIPAPPDVGSPPSDAQKTASGLASKILTPGTGDKHPQPQDVAKVHYTGWTTDGKMFDSSIPRGQLASRRSP